MLVSLEYESRIHTNNIGYVCFEMKDPCLISRTLNLSYERYWQSGLINGW